MPLTNEFLAGVLGSTNYEPIRTNNALLRITDVGSKVGIGDATEALKLSLAGFSLPKNETSPIGIPYLNEMRKYAGQTMFDDISVSFHDYVDRHTADILWAWRYKIHDPSTGLRGLKSQYACQGEIEHFAPDGSGSRIYRVVNIWPMNLDMGDIEMGADEAIRLQVRFACDKIYPVAGQGWPTFAGVAQVGGSLESTLSF